jgi:hypothetical protein
MKKSYEFYYETMPLKSGDVIAFSGIGMLSSLTKLRCGIDFSQVGIVLVLPNLYTQRPELYLAEVTSNHDGMVNLCLTKLYFVKLTHKIHPTTNNNIIIIHHQQNIPYIQIDAFAERAKRAVCVFRLFERLHQYHGGDIVLLPLREQLSGEAANAMVTWIWQV